MHKCTSICTKHSLSTWLLMHMHFIFIVCLMHSIEFLFQFTYLFIYVVVGCPWTPSDPRCLVCSHYSHLHYGSLVWILSIQVPLGHSAIHPVYSNCNSSFWVVMPKFTLMRHSNTLEWSSSKHSITLLSQHSWIKHCYS